MPSSPHTLARHQPPSQRYIESANRQRDAQDEQPMPDNTCCDPDLLAYPIVEPPKPTGLLMTFFMAVALVGALVLLFAVAPWVHQSKN